MKALKIGLMIALAIVSILLTIIVLMQEGQEAGLGSIEGMADSYWGKNKGRSAEGKLLMATRILGALFIILAAALNLSVFS